MPVARVRDGALLRVLGGQESESAELRRLVGPHAAARRYDHAAGPEREHEERWVVTAARGGAAGFAAVVSLRRGVCEGDEERGVLGASPRGGGGGVGRRARGVGAGVRRRQDEIQPAGCGSVRRVRAEHARRGTGRVAGYCGVVGGSAAGRAGRLVLERDARRARREALDAERARETLEREPASIVVFFGVLEGFEK